MSTAHSSRTSFIVFEGYHTRCVNFAFRRLLFRRQVLRLFESIETPAVVGGVKGIIPTGEVLFL
jgi:hypothetical protein